MAVRPLPAARSAAQGRGAEAGLGLGEKGRDREFQGFRARLDQRARTGRPGRGGRGDRPCKARHDDGAVTGQAAGEGSARCLEGEARGLVEGEAVDQDLAPRSGGQGHPQHEGAKRTIAPETAQHLRSREAVGLAGSFRPFQAGVGALPFMAQLAFEVGQEEGAHRETPAPGPEARDQAKEVAGGGCHDEVAGKAAASDGKEPDEEEAASQEPRGARRASRYGAPARQAAAGQVPFESGGGPWPAFHFKDKDRGRTAAGGGWDKAPSLPLRAEQDEGQPRPPCGEGGSEGGGIPGRSGGQHEILAWFGKASKESRLESRRVIGGGGRCPGSHVEDKDVLADLMQGRLVAIGFQDYVDKVAGIEELGQELRCGQGDYLGKTREGGVDRRSEVGRALEEGLGHEIAALPGIAERDGFAEFQRGAAPRTLEPHYSCESSRGQTPFSSRWNRLTVPRPLGYARAMKIWMKYLVGAVLGVAIALVVPIDDVSLRGTLAFLAELSIRIGRYALIPLILFSLPVAVFELNEDKEFWRLLGRSLLLILVSVACFTIIGVVTTTACKPSRIPLLSDAGSAAATPGIKDLLLAVFPSSFFKVFTDSGDFLLPVYFLAILLGFAFSYDKIATKPVVSFFDSLSRIFYQINSFFAEFLGVLVIAVTAFNVLGLRMAVKSEIYRPLLIVIGAEVLAVTFIVIPAVLYFACGRKHPYRWLYAFAAPALAALVSGDVYFPLGSITKHAKESLGIRRRANSVVLPLTVIFGRAGTALVTASAFIAVLSSYSSLGISVGSLLWILAVAPLLTLLLGAAPGSGAMTALVALCAFYGKGFENGYLIILPIAFPLISAGAFLDMLWSGCMTLMLARDSGQMQEKEVRFYI